MTYLLRSDQRAAVDALEASCRSRWNSLCVQPTGSGKSIIIAELVKRLAPDSRYRILVISHTSDIVRQDASAIRKHCPETVVTCACSGLDETISMTGHVIVGTIQTLRSRSLMMANVKTVIVDEAHAIPSASTSMYRKLFNRITEDCGEITVVGLTATPYRLDSGFLHTGRGALFDGICHETTVSDLVARRILSPLVAPSDPVSKIDISHMRRMGRDGDYVAASISESEGWEEQTRKAILNAIKLCSNRKKILVFACSNKQAEAIETAINNVRPTEYVSHKTPKPKRLGIMKGFRNGNIDILVNIEIATVGLDVPDIDAIVFLRPTMSTGLYVQMLGRGMRMFEGKKDCLVLDYVGNIDHHGPLEDINPEKSDISSGDGAASNRVGGHKPCPECHEFTHSFSQSCPKCGALFFTVEPEASISSPMRSAIPKTRSIPKSTRALLDAGKIYARDLPESRYPYLSTHDAARFLRYGYRYVVQMRMGGDGPTYYSLFDGVMTREGIRMVVYRREDLEKWDDETPSITGVEKKMTYRRRKRKINGAETDGQRQ